MGRGRDVSGPVVVIIRIAVLFPGYRYPEACCEYAAATQMGEIEDWIDMKRAAVARS